MVYPCCLKASHGDISFAWITFFRKCCLTCCFVGLYQIDGGDGVAEVLEQEVGDAGGRLEKNRKKNKVGMGRGAKEG